MATIQEAVIQVTADASGVKAGMAEATKAVKDFENTAKSAAGAAGAGLANANKQVAESAGALTREQQNLIASINRYSERVGRTRGEVLELRAANLGLTSQLQQQITAIKAAETAAARAGNTLDRYGKSARENAANLRQVPAQFTDIVVGLQSGQAPLTVLLQQGGQLKDVFGGVLPAFRALGGYVLGLITPLTVLAAGAGAFALAAYKGAQETQALNAALITTGNAVGRTASSLSDMAARIDSVVGTQSAAAEAIGALVQTGVVGSNSLERFATTAIRTQRLLGTSVADTAKTFADLARDPVKATERLNESMNYLTLDVYRQITALEAQGRTLEAGVVAQRAYADAQDAQNRQLEQNLGTLERLWRGVRDAAAEGWDAMLNVGRPDTLATQIARQEAIVRAARNGESGFASNGGGAAFGVGGQGSSRAKRDREDAEAALESLKEADRLERRAALARGEEVATNKRLVEAQGRMNALEKETATNADKRAKALKQLAIDAKDLNYSAEKTAKLEAAINDRYKDPKGRTARAYQDDEATRYLLTQKQIEASLREQLSTDEKLTAAQKELAKFNQEIADLKEKKILTADQKSLLARESEARAQLETNAALSVQVKQMQEKAKAEKEAADAAERYRQAVEGVNISMASAQQSRADQSERTLGSFGMGDRAREQLEAQRQIEREFQRYQDQITKAAARTGQLGSEKYAQDMAAVAAMQAEELSRSQEHYSKLYELQANWVNGASRGLELYYEQSRDVAGQIQGVFTGAFTGLTDVLTEFARTGKLRLSELAGSIAGDVSKAIINTQVTGPLANLVNGQMKSDTGFGSILNSVFGGIFGSNGTGGGAGDAAAGAGMLSLATGAGAATAALSALAAAAGAAAGGLGGSSVAGAVTGSSGGGIFEGVTNWFGSLFGRANGGDVQAGGMYQVAENAPEMLTVGNKQFLMMGAQSGQVSTMGSGARNVTVNVTQMFSPGTDKRTTAQAAQDTRRAFDGADRIS